MKKALKKKAVKKQQPECQDEVQGCCCYCVYDPCGCYSATTVASLLPACCWLLF